MSRTVGTTTAVVPPELKYLFAILIHTDAITPGNAPNGTRNQR